MTQPWNVIAAMVRRLADRVDALPAIREATVTSVSPIAVRFDTDTVGVAVQGTLAGSLSVGDRVLTVRLARYIWLLGRKGGMPYARGQVAIIPSAADTPTGVTVTFPVGMFSVAPTPGVLPLTGGPGTVVKGVSALNVTTTSMTIYLTRADTTQTSVAWMAIA